MLVAGAALAVAPSVAIHERKVVAYVVDWSDSLVLDAHWLPRIGISFWSKAYVDGMNRISYSSPGRGILEWAKGKGGKVIELYAP